MWIVIVILAAALGADLALGADEPCKAVGFWGQFMVLFASVSAMCRAIAEILTNAAKTAERFERRGALIAGYVLRVLSYPFVKLGFGHPDDARKPTWPAKVSPPPSETKGNSA